MRPQRFTALIGLTGSFLVVTSTALAQTSCGVLDFELVSDTSVQGLNSSPAQYQGDITGGSLSPGTWTLTFDDAGWPSPGGQRTSYIKSLYTYDSQAQTFTAVFSADEVQLELAGPNVSLSGAATVTFVAPDSNGNGKLSTSELNAQTMSAGVGADCASGASSCGGSGSATGAMSLDAVTTPLTGALDTQACATAVDETAWGLVKVRYRE